MPGHEHRRAVIVHHGAVGQRLRGLYAVFHQRVVADRAAIGGQIELRDRENDHRRAGGIDDQARTGAHHRSITYPLQARTGQGVGNDQVVGIGRRERRVVDGQQVGHRITRIDKAAGRAGHGFVQRDVGRHQVHINRARGAARSRHQAGGIGLRDDPTLVGRLIQHHGHDFKDELVSSRGGAVRCVLNISQIPLDSVIEGIGVGITGYARSAHRRQARTTEIGADRYDARTDHLQHRTARG